MKNLHARTPKNSSTAGEKRRPENKDNLDSRTGEEQQFKGNDITHNRKDKKSGNKKTSHH
jgi:hypothetical protein